MRLLTVLLGSIAALLPTGAAAPGSESRKPRPKPVPVEQSQALWATINVCDPAEAGPHANTIGIRGSMPGLGDRRSTLQMRFQVQYEAKDGMWHNSDESADSGWKTVGRRVRTKIVESGQDFTFVPPAAGSSHFLRGSVRFKWVRRGRVVKRARRLTEGGHVSTAGADPSSYSSATCNIVAP